MILAEFSGKKYSLSDILETFSKPTLRAPSDVVFSLPHLLWSTAFSNAESI